MTTTALTKRHDHLVHNRRMLIGRSLAATVAGTLPFPLVEEWLSSTITRRTIARIADSHAVDMSDEALRAIADGPRRAPEWTDVAGGTLAGKLLTRGWRKLLIGVIAARRTQVAGHTFLVATLFDHYCARLHVGLGLDGHDAAELRSLMGKAITSTSGGLSRHMFRRAVVSAARATAKAPLEIADIATGGAVRKLLTRGDEVEAVTEVDEELERQMAAKDSFLARAAFIVELELSADSNPYLDDLIEAFESLWRKRKHRTSTNDS